MTRPARRETDRRLDSARRLADYATAFDFLGKLAGATTERSVVESVFDLFTLIFAPDTVIYLSIRDGEPAEAMWRSSVAVDVEAAKSCMLQLDAEHASTPSGKGFDIAIGQGPTREILRVEGVRFVEYRDHYLNLALNVAPVLHLALTNARNFQRLHDEEARLRAAILARDMVLAFVSHDLKNPLTSIAISARALEQCGPVSEDDRARDSARSIRQSAARMNRMIEDLLDVSRMEAGVFKVRATECAARDVLHEALREVRPQLEALDVRVEERCDEGTLLRCDRDRIVRVLSNLVGNALKFAPEHGGVITIDCEDRGGDVLFTVTDNGPGIRPEDLPHVFDIFWQGRHEKQAGAGLGLAIARGIVEAHGGRIWVESVLDEGAAFSFTVPRGG